VDEDHSSKVNFTTDTVFFIIYKFIPVESTPVLKLAPSIDDQAQQARTPTKPPLAPKPAYTPGSPVLTLDGTSPAPASTSAASQQNRLEGMCGQSLKHMSQTSPLGAHPHSRLVAPLVFAKCAPGMNSHKSTNTDTWTGNRSCRLVANGRRFGRGKHTTQFCADNLSASSK
jgi:hypothetical protein